MVEYENICRGALGFKPSLNHKKLSQTEYNNQLARNIAKNSNMPIEEVKECMRYE